MMKKRILTLLVLLAYFVTGYGQSKKELIELGDAAFNAGNYGSAVFYYKRIVEFVPTKYDLSMPYEIKAFYKAEKKSKSDSGPALDTSDYGQVTAVNRLAESYRQLKDYSNAEKWYAVAASVETKIFPDAKYYYGVTLMNNEKYEDAQKVFEKYIEGLNTDSKMFPLANNRMVSCSFALNPENRTDGITIHDLDSNFNAGTASFGAGYFTDKSLMITSARKGNTILDPKNETDYFTTDIYIISYDTIGSYDQAQKMPAPVSSNMNEAGGCMSVDRTTFYFTRWNPEDKNDCAIYVSKLFNRRWMEPLKLDVVNADGYRTMNPSLTLDEKKLFFSSNRPGGEGGMDIWYCPIDENGDLGLPINAGPEINTPDDEVTPFLHHQTGTLFFSSNGLRGFGGLDVFKAAYNEDEDIWQNPINMNSPVNSSKDDYYFILDSKKQTTGFFTSDRQVCKQCDTTQDISGNCNRVYMFTKGTIEFSLSGYVYNAQTDEVIPNAMIEIKDVDGNLEPDFIFTDDNGYYEKELGPEWELFLKAKKSKFFADMAAVKTKGLTESTALEQDFYLRQIPDEEIEIPGIEYDFDSDKLRPRSKEILDQLYDFLVVNDNLIVEINSHTDCRGNDKYNESLAQRRAKSCVDYLISKGIPKGRLSPKGYGEYQPAFHLDKDKNPIKDANGEKILLTEKFILSLPTELEREEAHQRNRRTAFKVVGQDFKLESN
jgi:outer membrane protein OmpA-like peptidoglycan-associated protein/tetratricopeptide (TPR) repeat protein